MWQIDNNRSSGNPSWMPLNMRDIDTLSFHRMFRKAIWSKAERSSFLPACQPASQAANQPTAVQFQYVFILRAQHQQQTNCTQQRYIAKSGTEADVYHILTTPARHEAKILNAKLSSGLIHKWIDLKGGRKTSDSLSKVCSCRTS